MGSYSNNWHIYREFGVHRAMVRGRWFEGPQIRDVTKLVKIRRMRILTFEIRRMRMRIVAFIL